MAVAAEVRFISTETIRPATHTDSTQRIELTPWDLTLLARNPIQKGLLFHQPTTDTWLTQLKTSLSRALDHFFPLAGRLATETRDDNNDTITVFIHCNNAGAQFIHATVDLTVSDIVDSPYVHPTVQDFFPLKDMINYDGRFQPLVSIQVTELNDGIFIGCTMNHTIADGESFWHFINSWSEISKTGPDRISRRPVLSRWFLKPTDLPVQLPTLAIEKSIHTSPLDPLDEQILHFTPRNIAKLKLKANLENSGSNEISSLQAVLAHVWLAVTRVRNLDCNQEVRFKLVMGNRGRVVPPLPREYFGNSIGSSTTTTEVGKLLDGGLGFAARLLNEVVASQTSIKISTAWENWVKKPTINTTRNLVGKIILVAGSSPWFDVYGNDFGWGCPISVQSGSGNKYNGKITIFPGGTTGSMDILTCLLPETLRDLSEDSELMKYVGVHENEDVAI